MQRARHRWTSLSLICLFIITQLPSSSAVKATSLIFSKTTSTTAAPEEIPSASDDGVQPETTGEGEATNSTTKLSGIPQIDYIHDPNLPRELNGYNLSEYPFLETVPPLETIDFKCDGLHDGFYASIPHKCQLYHHCLFGTRYDFLCANYTAFDQKTFICQFVSEVDCKNSANYFNRNEALYKATTAAPPPPPPSTTTTTTPRPPPPRPGRRRPYYRADYYDDDYYYPARDDYDYEERGGRGRPRRPAGRPGKRRPYDYDEDRYESRPRSRDEEEEEFDERRPYEDRRRPAKRPDRRPYDEEDRRPSSRGGKRPRPRDEEDRYRPRDSIRPKDDLRPRNETRYNDERRDMRPRDEDDRPLRPRDDDRRDMIRPRDEDRRGSMPREEDRRDAIRPREKDDEKNDRFKPREKDDERGERFKPRDKDDERGERFKPRDKDDDRRDTMRPRDRSRDERRPMPRDDDRYSNEGRRHREERPYRNRDEGYTDKEEDREEKKPNVPLVKPNGHGIFGQPRMPPPIKRPVPANERKKYEYVAITTTKAPPPKDDEYYDYEDDEVSKPSFSAKTSTIQQRPKPEPIEKEKFKPSRPLFATPPSYKNKQPAKPIEYEDDEYYYETVPKSQKNQNTRMTERPAKSSDDYYEDYDVKDRERDVKRGEDITSRIKDVKPNVRVVKRPFLPSRGGSPYLPRGLQPIAGRNMSVSPSTTPKPITTSTKLTTPATTTTSTTTRTTTTTTTTPEPTTTTQQTTTYVTTEKPTTTEQQKATEEYEEYYDEEDIDYEAKNQKESTTTVENEPKSTVETETRTEDNQHQHQPTTTEQQEFEQTYKPTTTTVVATTTRAMTTKGMSPEQRAKNLASKVLKTYNDQYEAVKKQLQTTLNPGDYANAFLSLPLRKQRPYQYKPEEFIPMEVEDSKPKKPYQYQPDEFVPTAVEAELPAKTKPELKPSEEIQEDYKTKLKEFKPLPKIQPKPDISKPYTATSKPFIPENISIKQNLADSVENDYDVRYNEAISPVPVSVRAPQGFVVPSDNFKYTTRFRSNLPAEPQYAASELQSYQLRKRPQISGVSIRTPSSFYLQRYDDGIPRHPRQILFRQVGGYY